MGKLLALSRKYKKLSLDSQNPKKARCGIVHLFPSDLIARWEAEATVLAYTWMDGRRQESKA